MKDLHRVPVLAIIFLVVLRMAIGWQFLYEGLWKYDTMSGPNPWTAEGYLKNAQGPFRDYFRDMTGDPDDLKWLDYAVMSRRWYDYRDRFVKHFRLTDSQKNELNKILDGSVQNDTPADEFPPTPSLLQPLGELPKGLSNKDLEPQLHYDADKKQLVASMPILESEEAALLKKANVVRNEDGSYGKLSAPEETPDEAAMAFANALRRVAFQSRELSYRHRLAADLRGNPENTGVIGVLNEHGSFDYEMGTLTPDDDQTGRHSIRYGKIQEYKDLVKDYNKALNQAAIDYQYEHATMLGRKLALMRAELVGPIRALDAGFKKDAMNLLTAEQLRYGKLPPESTPLTRSDRQVTWGLIVLGALLIVGLASRLAAVCGAVMLFMFYLVMPPWPGVPPLPGPEHSFIVNKNLIESIALLGLAALPTGSWFGIDALFSGCCRRKSAAPETETSETPSK